MTRQSQTQSYRGSSRTAVGHGVSSYTLFLELFLIAEGILRRMWRSERPRCDVVSAAGSLKRSKHDILNSTTACNIAAHGWHSCRQRTDRKLEKRNLR